MPTEEVFTAPLRDGIDGVVYAALPLVHNGNIIENFHFVIKDGKIVEAHAEKGEDILKAAIAEDEGASYFGEVALVPMTVPFQTRRFSSTTRSSTKTRPATSPSVRRTPSASRAARP